MSIATEITRLRNAKEAIKTSIINKEVTVPDTATIDEYPSLIDSIESGSGGVKIEEYFETAPKNGNTKINHLIKRVPEIDTSNLTSGYCLFQDCSKLTSIPWFNTSNMTAGNYMFSQCSLLETVPEIDTSNMIQIDAMFQGCRSLTAIPQINTQNVENFNGLFNNCSNLTSVPALDTSKATNIGYMFTLCTKLKSTFEINASKVTNVAGFVNYCSSLTEIGPLVNLGEAYSTSSSENAWGYSLDLSYCKSLSHDSLVNLFNNLYDIASKGCNKQKINLGTENLAKLTQEEIAIATNKGWNVT